MTAAARLRSLLAADQPVAAPGVLDPLTARVVEGVGCDALYLSGNAIAMQLGVAQPLVTLTETLTAASNITRVVQVPLVVDFGAGFGEAAQVQRAVREAERAGIAAVHLDDQPYPKQMAYHRGAGSVVEAARFARRIQAACEARRTDLVVIARLDALRVTGSLDDVVDRAHLAVAAGADALTVLDLEPADLAPIRGRLPDVPIAWLRASAGHPLRTLGEAGFSAALYPFNTLAGVIDVTERIWRPLVEGGALEQSVVVIERGREAMIELLDLQRAWDLERALDPISQDGAE